MADYQKMYAVLCAAIDDVLNTLETNPTAYSETKKLQKALLEAEDIYIETTVYAEERKDSRMIMLKADSNNV